MSIVCVAVLLAASSGCKSGPTAMDYLGDAQMALADHRYQEAQSFLDLARDKGAPERDIRVLRSKIERRRALEALEAGEDRQAYEQFIEAAELDPRRRASAQTYLKALDIGQRLGLEPPKLAPIAQKAVDADPSLMRARRIAGQLWEAMGEPKKALRSYLWLWQADRSQTQVGRRLAMIYQQLGRPDDAIAILEQILEESPDDAQAGMRLADLYANNGRPHRAREIYERLVEQYPEKPGILLRYSRFLEERGNRRRAEALKERAYDQMPGRQKREMRDLR